MPVDDGMFYAVRPNKVAMVEVPGFFFKRVGDFFNDFWVILRMAHDICQCLLIEIIFFYQR
jgi:hypothetical protein